MESITILLGKTAEDFNCRNEMKKKRVSTVKPLSQLWQLRVLEIAMANVPGRQFQVVCYTIRSMWPQPSAALSKHNNTMKPFFLVYRQHRN